MTVTFPAMSNVNASAAGISNVRSRINEIQRMLGVQAALSGSPGASTLGMNGDQFSFRQALQQAGSGTSSAQNTALMQALGTTPVYASKPAELPPVTVSDAMRAVGNGRLPDAMLTPIGQGDHKLAKPAADAFTRLMNAARRDGVSIGVTDSYRDYAGQVAVADKVGLYGQGGLGAVPGTSNHGWGLAVDLDLDAKAQGWMRDNGWRYGFFEDVAGEPWHWTYRSAK
jgi:zinc D-Ala-D-Ala carboxypeptidase